MGAGRALRRGATALTGGLLAAGLALPAAATTLPADQDVTPGVYLVVLEASPAASYAGGTMSATRPLPGHRFDRTSAAVRGYRAHLLAGQDLLLHAVGDPTVLYRYTVALDGFAARLDGDQVKALRADARVDRVERAHTQRLDGALSAGAAVPSAGVVQPRSGGPADAGRRTVIGVVDTGLWPGGAVFAALPQLRPGTSPQLRGFHGGCATAPTWSATDCNDKVVSARWFVRGFGGTRIARSDSLSARDGSGHGTAVASLAAGNTGVAARVDGQSFGSFGGTAPAARIAVYKACWSAPDPADDGCSTADVVAAVDQAVADGVDVLTSSLADDGGGSRDAVQQAYLGAADAGVVVTAAAGNDSGSAHNAAPWVTTVGASSRPAYQGTARLGDGSVLSGSMVSDRRVAGAALVSGARAAATGATPRDARLCVPGALDAAQVQGAVVLCERGQVARVDKSAAVRMAGGAGMLLLNTRAGGTASDIHDVPTVHLDAAAARRVRGYLRAAGAHATVTLDPTPLPRHRTARVAGFSAGGPVTGVVKPDVTAPGVAVLGAVAPGSDDGRAFDLLTGTSASTPQVAGLAASVRSVHPAWPAARVRSALVTTAHGIGPATRAGAGEVTARRVLDPGLVLDAAAGPWQRWLSGEVRAADLNLPSLAVPELVRATTVVRRLTNVSARTETYGVRLARPAGVDVTVRPSVFRLAAGRTRTVRITVTARPTAHLDTWVSGALTWVSPRHTVRLPLAVRARPVAAPRQVSADASAGSARVVVRVATAHALTLRTSGLVPATTRSLSLRPTALDPAHPLAVPGSAAVPLEVPRGSTLLRARVAAAAGDDVDLYLFRGGRLVAAATSGSTTDGLTLVRPAAGDYTLQVHAARAGNSLAARATLSTWVVPARAGASGVPVTVRGAATPAGRSTVTVVWGRHRVAHGHWLGVVSYGRRGGQGRLTVLDLS